MTKRWCRRRYHRLTLYHVPVDSTWRALVRFIIAGVAQADIPLDLYENLDKSCNRNAFVPDKNRIVSLHIAPSSWVYLYYCDTPCLFCNTNGAVCTTNMYYLLGTKKKKMNKNLKIYARDEKWKQQQRYWVCCCDNYTWFNIQRITGNVAYHLNRIRPSAQAESCWATSFWWSA